MENTERFEQLLRTQSYQELSLADREWMAQFVSSEEAYEAMRRATQQMEEHVAPEKLLPEPAILKSLMKSLDEKHRSTRWSIRSTWSIPAYASLAAVLAVGVMGWWVGSSWGKETVYVDRMITRVDTVRVVSKPDTLVIERVVYQNVSLPTTSAIVKQTGENIPLVNRGVNMKEKEELEKLLVSGGF